MLEEDLKVRCGANIGDYAALVDDLAGVRGGRRHKRGTFSNLNQEEEG